MEDPNLSDVGREQLKTDRKNFFPQAPFSPDIFNVPSKPDATSDTDNYRNDLLKQYCKNVSSAGGRYDTAFDMMKKFGQKKKSGGTVTTGDLDSAVDEVTRDTTDAVGQVKYLLCQQADGFVAPPRPAMVPDGSSVEQLFEEAYNGRFLYTWLTGVFFAILSVLLIINYIFRLFQNPQSNKKIVLAMLIVGGLFTTGLFAITATPYCLEKGNVYYDPETSGPGSTLIRIYIGIFLGSLLLTLLAYWRKSNWFFSLGLFLPLALLFSLDIWMAVFKPQLFILFVIFLRLITYRWDDSGWAMPFVSIYGLFTNWMFNKATQRFDPGTVRGPSTPSIFEVSNEQLFKPKLFA